MSYLFDGANDSLTGAMATSYNGEAITIACYFKVASHPGVIDGLVYFGNNASSNNDSHALRTNATDNNFHCTSFNAAGTAGNAQVALTDLTVDGIWVPIVGKFTADNSRTVYAGTFANSDLNGDSRAVADALKFLHIGESLAGGNDFVGRIAEIAIWKAALSDADITSYMTGSAASGINAANLIGYWPLSTASLANLGTDTDGDLTANGGAVFDADHPTISSGGGSFTLAVSKADIAMAGQSIPLNKGMPVTRAQFSAVGQTIVLNSALAVTSASISPIGQSINLAWEQDDLRIDVGSASLALAPANIILALKSPVTAAAFSLVGQSITLTLTTVPPGSFAIPVGSAAPTISGSDVVLEDGRKFDHALPTIAGKTINLDRGIVVTSATPTIAGQSIGLTLGGSTVLSVDAASFSIVGQSIDFQQTWSVDVGSASLSIIGQNIPLQFQIADGVTVDSAQFSIIGQAVPLDRGIRFTAATPSIAGSDVSLRHDIFMSVLPAEIEIDGQDIGLSNTFTLGITVVPAEFSIVGSEIIPYLGSGTPNSSRNQSKSTEAGVRIRTIQSAQKSGSATSAG